MVDIVPVFGGAESKRLVAGISGFGGTAVWFILVKNHWLELLIRLRMFKGQCFEITPNLLLDSLLI